MSEDMVYVGSCGVDSGQLVIVDPCYAFEDEYFGSKSAPTGGNYDHICRVSLSERHCGPIGLPARGYDGPVGVVVSTGYGDGCYPVYAKMSQDGRIASVTIEFIDEEGV